MRAIVRDSYEIIEPAAANANFLPKKKRLT